MIKLIKLISYTNYIITILYISNFYQKNLKTIYSYNFFSIFFSKTIINNKKSNLLFIRFHYYIYNI